jgi:cell division protein FtsX
MNDDFLRDNRNRSRYLDQRERDVLLRHARDVEQAARRCDHRSAEDEARTRVRIASQRTVEREQAIRQIQRLQGIVRTASRW